MGLVIAKSFSETKRKHMCRVVVSVLSLGDRVSSFSLNASYFGGRVNFFAGAETLSQLIFSASLAISSFLARADLYSRVALIHSVAKLACLIAGDRWGHNCQGRPRAL